MPLATTNALFFSSPFFVSIFAKFFLKEFIGIRRWSAIIFGFVGVYIVLNPNFSALAKASSVVPIFEQLSLNFLNSGSSFKFLHISWSTEIAIKLAPKIVSGRVQGFNSSFWRSKTRSKKKGKNKL